MIDDIADGSHLTGFADWAVGVMETLGAPGAGLVIAIENLFPPLPSEVILPLAGFIAQRGDMNIVLVIVLSTAGAWVGALVLYFLGAWLGEERAIRLLSRLPLVDEEDFEKASRWFSRHGRPAVFFGRLIPGVRSVISLPAGAQRMSLLTFSVFTIAGSAVWNSLLVLLGAALGTQYELLDRYSNYLDYAVYAAIAVVIGWLVIRRIRRRRMARTE